MVYPRKCFLIYSSSPLNQVKCFEPHPEQNGKQFWYFWPIGQVPPGLPPSPPAGPSSLSPATLLQSPGPSLTPIVFQAPGVCAFPGCTKHTPKLTSTCANAMCKFHCIMQGGCTTGTQHQMQFTSKRQKKCVIDTSTAMPILPPASGLLTVEGTSTTAESAEETVDDDDQFHRDVETAHRLSLHNMQHFDSTTEPPPLASTSSTFSYVTSSPLHIPPTYAPQSYIPGSSPPLPSVLPTDTRPLLMSGVHALVVKAKQTQKGKQPKITSQMNTMWAAEYKIGAVQLSAKAQKDQARLSNWLIAERQIDLVHWDRVRACPSI